MFQMWQTNVINMYVDAFYFHCYGIVYCRYCMSIAPMCIGYVPYIFLFMHHFLSHSDCTLFCITSWLGTIIVLDELKH